MPTLSPGQIIADKYRVDSVIGTGGMGIVLAATHVELEQRVAIKLLRDASDNSIARFKREARLLVKLKSEHVARVFDVGSLDDDTPYIVMERLEGHDLAKLVELQGRLTVEQAVDYVLEATEAVAEAHVLGMVHRDLKPANLFLSRGPGGATTVKVLDFGISKMLDVQTEQTTAGVLTNEGVALGSPGYMAPEQMTSSRDVDVRADIYSLGAMLYRLVSGRNPYKGHSLVEVLASMAIDPLPPLATFVPDVPEDFARAVERCLAQDREARFPSVAHFADAFSRFASRRGRESAQQILATMNVAIEPFGATIIRPILPSVPAGSASLAPPVDAPPERSTMAYAVAGLVSAALVVVVIAIARPRGASPTPADPPPEPVPVPLTSMTSTTSAPIPEPPPPSASVAPRASAKVPSTKPRGSHPHGPSTAPPDPLGVPGGRH